MSHAEKGKKHYWARAPQRHRKRRVQKKIDARGGAMHYLPPRLRDLEQTEPGRTCSFKRSSFTLV